MSSSSNDVMRPVILILVFGLLTLGLFYRQHNAARVRKVLQETRQDTKQVIGSQVLIEDGMKFGEEIDDLDQTLLAHAQSAENAIAVLRQQRLAATTLQVPELSVSDGIRVQNDATAQYLQYRLRELEAYRRLAKDVDVARDAGEKFIEEYIQTAVASLHNSGKLIALGTTAIDAGSHDPLVRTYFAKVKLQIDGDTIAAEQVWNETAEQLVDAGFPRSFQVYARDFLCETVKPFETAVLRSRWRQMATAMARWLQEESAHPELRSSVCRRLLTIWQRVAPEDKTSVLAAVLQTNEIDPYYTHLLAGLYDQALAWRFRGTGLASTISPDRSASVEKYSNFAADHFQFNLIVCRFATHRNEESSSNTKHTKHAKKRSTPEYQGRCDENHC